MAWDHVSNFWMQIHGGLEGIYPFRNPDLDFVMFMARFISHFCAPTFVFLSGVSLALSVKKRVERGVSELHTTFHIIKRGVLLLIFEALLVAKAFDLPYLYFGVIATIGTSLIILSVGRKLPTWLIFAGSLIIILNHQWLDLSFIPMDLAWGHYLRRVLHEPGFTWYPYFSLYPVIPWLGVMGLGWVFGSFLHDSDAKNILELKLPLTITGFTAIVLFVIVRMLNGYGNLVRRWSNDILDWLYISKYPPSVAFLLLTLGGMCVFMAIGLFIEEKGWSRRSVSGIIHQFGRVPLFFYLTHLWLYRMRLPKTPAPFHLDLLQTFGLWILGLMILWVLCARYENLKRMYPRFLRYI
jgi:uncharacterized membrane protein